MGNGISIGKCKMICVSFSIIQRLLDCGGALLELIANLKIHKEERKDGKL